MEKVYPYIYIYTVLCFRSCKGKAGWRRYINIYIYTHTHCIVFQILQRESWMEAVRVQAKVHARMPTQSVPAPQPRNVPVKAGIRPLVARVVSFSFFCVTPAGYRFYQYCSP